MPSVNQRALVPYSAKQMYDLVNNYERYPEFVPGCVESRTLNRSERELTAELVISKAGIRQRFTTQNTMVENQQIQMQLVEGLSNFYKGNGNLQKLMSNRAKLP